MSTRSDRQSQFQQEPSAHSHSTFNSTSRASISISSGVRKRPRRMRVKKYNVDVSNSISSIDMSGKIEYGDYSSVTSMDRSTLQDIGRIQLQSPAIPSPLTKMDRKLGFASPGIDPNLVKNLLPDNTNSTKEEDSNKLLLLEENPSTQESSKLSSFSKSLTDSKTVSSLKSPTLRDKQIPRNENPDSTHARFSLSSKSSSDESESSSSSDDESDDDSVSDSDDESSNNDNDNDNEMVIPELPPRKSAPAAPLSPASFSSESFQEPDKYKFPSGVFKDKTTNDSQDAFFKEPNQNQKGEARLSPIVTDESTEGWYVDSHNDESTNLPKKEEKGLYERYKDIYNKNDDDAVPSNQIIKDAKKSQTDEDDSDDDYDDTIKKDFVSVPLKPLPKSKALKAKSHDETQETALSSNKDENTTIMPSPDGEEDSNDAQKGDSNESPSMQTKRSLDRERRFQVWLEHGIYLPASGSVAPSNESKSGSSSSSNTVSEDDDEEEEDEDQNNELDKSWWKKMGSVFQRKDGRATPDPESPQPSERSNSDADVVPNQGDSQAAANDTDGASSSEKPSDEEQPMDVLPNETVPAISEDEIYITEAEPTSGTSFADMVAARSRARMNKTNTTAPKRADSALYQKRDESSISASGGGSLADQIAAAARSRTKNPPSTQSAEEYDDKPYQTTTTSEVKEMSLADQIAAAAMKRKSKPATEEDYEKRYQPKQEVKKELSLAEQVAARANTVKLKSVEDYDKLYDKSQSNRSADTSLADMVAERAMKLKSRSGEKTEEDYNNLYDKSRSNHSMGSSLADQVKAAANKVKLRNAASPKTEEDYNKLYTPKKELNDRDELANQIAAAAMARRRNKSEEDFEKFYQKKTPEPKQEEPQFMFKLKPVEHRRTRAQRYFAANADSSLSTSFDSYQLDLSSPHKSNSREEKPDSFDTYQLDLSSPHKSNREQQNPNSFEHDIESIESPQKPNREKEKPHDSEDENHTSVSSTHNPDFDDIESSASSNREAKQSSGMMKASASPTDSPSAHKRKSSIRPKKCCWLPERKRCCRPFFWIIAIVSISLIVAAAWCLWFFVFAKRGDGSVTSPIVETRLPTMFPTLPVPPNPTASVPISPSPMPSFRPTNRPTGQPTFKPTFKPTFDPTQQEIPNVPTFQPIVAILPTNPPTNPPTNQPTNLPTNLPTLQPTLEPTAKPIVVIWPTNPPTNRPTNPPTSIPTNLPTYRPTNRPTHRPTNRPTPGPTSPPTPGPTFQPTPRPTPKPTMLPPTMPPTNQPVPITAKPTLAKPTELPEVTLLRQKLVSRWPSLGNSINVVASPQRKAFDWLIDSGVNGYSDQQLIQRFVMATFYFSTNGENWTNKEGWMSNKNECEWYQKSFREHCDSSGNLLILDLNGNGLSGNLPSELALLSNSFTGLDLGKTTDGNNAILRGSLPSEIGLLTKLQYLSLSNQEMTGTLPPEIGQLSLLNVLDLENNYFRGSLPASLGNLKMLYNFYLGSNNFSGSIPSQVGQMQYLVNLDIQENKLSSSLPSELGNLPILQSLTLGGNQLTGTIPTFLGQLSNLGKSLYLNDNRLSGTIPTELGQLTRLLTALNLSSNQLAGPIPAELDRLVNLAHLQLQKNLLTGTVPSSFSNLPELRILQLEFNNLGGKVAAPVCDALVLDKVDIGIVPTTILTDCLIEVDCPCCQYCCAELGGCECQFANTDKEYLCRFGNVLGAEARKRLFDDSERRM